MKNKTIPRVFLNTFEEIKHKYPTVSQNIVLNNPQHLQLWTTIMDRILSATEKNTSNLELESKKNLFLLTMS